MIPFRAYYEQHVGFGFGAKTNRQLVKDARQEKRLNKLTPVTTGGGTTLAPAPAVMPRRIIGPPAKIPVSPSSPAPGNIICTTAAGIGACFQCCSQNYQGQARRQCKRDCENYYGGTPPPPVPLPTPLPSGCYTPNCLLYASPLPCNCRAGYAKTRDGSACCPKPGGGSGGGGGSNCFTMNCFNPPCTCPTGWTQNGDQCCFNASTIPPTPPPGSGECRLNCGAGTGGVQCVYICDDYRSLPGIVPSGGTPSPIPYADYSGSYLPAETVEESTVTETLTQHWPWIVGGLAALYLFTRKQGQAA